MYNEKKGGTSMSDVKYDSAEARLDQFAGDKILSRANSIGYPQNQKSQLLGFYKWFFFYNFPSFFIFSIPS